VAFAGVLDSANYRAALAALGISDAAGNPLDGERNGSGGDNFGFDFFFLLGDADHDRDVDVNDLGILASNWQQSPRTFSQGDFDYTGTVDVNDLGILASQWQQQLAPPSAPATRRTPRRTVALVTELV